MKDNKLHFTKGIFLLLLITVLMFSSAGTYYNSEIVKTASSKEKKTQKEEDQKEQISAAPFLEAVVVSILNPDFAPDILLVSFDFPVLAEELIGRAGHRIVSEKYFRTLFTHIISPNAP